MSAIGKGDWLICVIGDAMYDHEVVAGSLYCVAEIDDDPTLNPCGLCGDPGADLLLEGIPKLPGAWCPCCFRPAGRGGMFSELLKASPVKIGEDA